MHVLSWGSTSLVERVPKSQPTAVSKQPIRVGQPDAPYLPSNPEQNCNETTRPYNTDAILDQCTKRKLVYNLGGRNKEESTATLLEKFYYVVLPQNHAAVQSILDERQNVFTTMAPLQHTTVAEHHIPTVHNEAIYTVPMKYGPYP
ncbi:hypothetical protein PR048_010350 [Dryococelus australis]|uniref:Uncharacterized protein n=1 Tax=Dryococelus australis TaxID=614101 RepID=A0ABQ9I3B3_9NEOP|nr:hypothetical protein PR048_010350 [Dryococelus australis]